MTREVLYFEAMRTALNECKEDLTKQLAESAGTYTKNTMKKVFEELSEAEIAEANANIIMSIIQGKLLIATMDALEIEMGNLDKLIEDLKSEDETEEASDEAEEVEVDMDSLMKSILEIINGGK